MKHAKKMVVGVLLLPLGVPVFGTGCANDSIDLPGATPSTSNASASPASFDQWLRAQCPDGHAVRITGAEVGGQVDTACEEVRERLVADASVRARLVSVYLAQTQDPTPLEPTAEASLPERTGEARQPGVLSGFFCSLALTFFIGYQCDKVRYPWSSCAAGSIPPSILCAVIGWTPVLP